MLSSIAHTLREMLYPSYCLLCRRRIAASEITDSICASCVGAIKPNIPPFCPRCGRNAARPDHSGNFCKACQNARYYFDRAWAGYAYEGTIKEMVHNFKYKNKINLGKHLCRLLIDFVREYHLPLNGCDCVIPVPLSQAKLREREFNQAQILAGAVSDYFGINLLSDALRRARNTASQTGLDRQKRRQNVKGAFALKNASAVKEKTILLIDDVLTTGATASEAAKTLKSAGANSVFVLTVAN